MGGRKIGKLKMRERDCVAPASLEERVSNRGKSRREREREGKRERERERMRV